MQAPLNIYIAHSDSTCNIRTSVDFRDDITGFVGGSCSSPGECNEMLDENPYIKSLVGFIGVILFSRGKWKTRKI